MKTLLVTGGTRGIGRAIVKLFAENGYNVAFTYKNRKDLADKLMEQYGVLAIRADSESEIDIRSAVDRVFSEFGHINCLINNAAFSSFRLFTDISIDEWNHTFAVSVTGAFLYSKMVLPDMISRKSGRIVNISSIWGLVGSSCEVHYSAAKAAIIGMTKALAKEVGPSGITVNAITPGVICTDMNEILSEADMKTLIDDTPLKRVGSPEEVARVALFLCGEGGNFITGDVLNISGGFVI